MKNTFIYIGGIPNKEGLSHTVETINTHEIVSEGLNRIRSFVVAHNDLASLVNIPELEQQAQERWRRYTSLRNSLDRELGVLTNERNRIFRQVMKIAHNAKVVDNGVEIIIPNMYGIRRLTKDPNNLVEVNERTLLLDFKEYEEYEVKVQGRREDFRTNREPKYRKTLPQDPRIAQNFLQGLNIVLPNFFERTGLQVEYLFVPDLISESEEYPFYTRFSPVSDSLIPDSIPLEGSLEFPGQVKFDVLSVGMYGNTFPTCLDNYLPFQITLCEQGNRPAEAVTIYYPIKENPRFTLDR